MIGIISIVILLFLAVVSVYFLLIKPILTDYKVRDDYMLKVKEDYTVLVDNWENAKSDSDRHRTWEDIKIYQRKIMLECL